MSTLDLPPTETDLSPILRGAVQNIDPSDVPIVRLWASWSLKCARWVGFRLFEYPPDFIDDWDLQKRALGEAIDRAAKAVLVEQCDAEIDVRFTLLPDVRLGGEGDAVLDVTPAGSAAVEIKSTSVKKIRGLRGNWSGTPAGPDAGWVAQTGMLAVARRLDAIYLAVFANDDLRLPPVEWLIPLGDPLPHLTVFSADGHPPTVRDLTIAEARRLGGILDLVEHGTLPTRTIPGFGKVLDPPARNEMGDPWSCRWCPYQPSCSKLPAGRVEAFRRVA